MLRPLNLIAQCNGFLFPVSINMLTLHATYTPTIFCLVVPSIHSLHFLTPITDFIFPLQDSHQGEYLHLVEHFPCLTTIFKFLEAYWEFFG